MALNPSYSPTGGIYDVGGVKAHAFVQVDASGNVVTSSGASGNTVLNGTGAPDANTGSDGDFYIDTDAEKIYGPKTDGAWDSGTSLIGPQGSTGATGSAGAKGDKGDTGAAGTNGNTILNGTGAPGAVGVDGDFYIDTSAWAIYGPKTSGAWGSGTSLIGPAA